MVNNVKTLITKYAEKSATDIHIVANVKPKYRKNGQLYDTEEDPCSPDDCRELAEQLAGNNLAELEENGEIDFAYNCGAIRCRVNIFMSSGHYSVSIRIFGNDIPKLKELNVPKPVLHFPEINQGLIILTGKTNSGKTTTLASIINEINHTYRKHIITLEDPIEYVFIPDKSIINQREIGKDTKTFRQGLKNLLRADPDIISIGELRDRETVETAMLAAESGQLVFATMHTKSATETIDKLINICGTDNPEQKAMQISLVLKAVLTQQFVPCIDGDRVLAYELMTSSVAVRTVIRENKTHQLESVMMSHSASNTLMDRSLETLYRNGKISLDTAVSYATHPDIMKNRSELLGYK